MKTTKEFLNDERTNKVIKVLWILSLMMSTARLVFCVVNYGPKFVESVKNKIAENKKQKDEHKRFTTMRKMYNEVGAEGINDYVEENKFAFEICNNFEERIN